MASTARFIAGGLLSGLGQGLTENGRAARERALEDLRHQRLLQREELGHTRTLERDELGHGRVLERDELQHGRTLERDTAGRQHDLTLEGMRDRRARDLQASGLSHAAAMAQAEREFRGSEADADRSFRREQGLLGHAQTMQLEGLRGERLSSTVTDEDRNLVGITASGRARGLGVRMPSAQSARDLPPDARLTEYLIETGVAPNHDEAWRMVREAKSNPDSYTRMVLDLAKARVSADATGRTSIEAAVEEARTTLDRLIALDEGRRGSKPAPGRQGEPQEVRAAPAPLTDEQRAAAARRGREAEESGYMPRGGGGAPATERGATAAQYPEAPRDPAQRRVGQVYRAPATGRLVEWTGQGWRPVD